MWIKDETMFKHASILSLCKQILILLSTIWMIDSECPKKCTCGVTNDLVAINCEDRDLTRIPGGISNDTELLRFRGNQIVGLPANMSQLFPKLKKIDLENNAIRRLPPGAFSGLSHLYSITLTANQITEVGGKIFSGIQKELIVSMTHNNLTSLPHDLLEGYNNLISLYLEENKISSLSSKVFNGFTKLQLLTLKGNRLTTIPKEAFNDIHELFSLDLASNQIKKLEEGTFKGLPSLETLLLQNNQLQSLHKDIFKGLIRLKSVDLRGNKFNYPPKEALTNLHENVKVKMFNNPLICDCSLASIIKNETIRQKISDINDITCQHSKALVLSAIEQLNCLPEVTTKAPTTTATPITQERAGLRTQKPTTATSNHLPLLISIILGVFIILTITTVFVYLYRRPIMGRIVRVRTLSYHKRAEEKEKVHSKEQLDRSPESMRDLPDSAFV